MKKSNRFLSAEAFCIYALVFAIIAAIFFMHGRFSPHWYGYIVMTDVVGQYGDFVGGVIGTILSVLLLYRALVLQNETLNLQREDSVKQAMIVMIQQLNDVFFKLLDQYNSLISTLVYQCNNNELTGRPALDEMLH